MTRRDDPARLRTSREFLSYAERAGCTVRTNGRHAYVTAPNGRGCPVPQHPGDIAPGTRRSILRLFAAMGIAVVLVIVVVLLV